MKKFVTLVLALFLMIPLAGGVVAEDADKPWLLYGNDPDESDIYETYGDTYFLDKYPVKTPNGQMFIRLNSYTTKKMIESSEKEGSLAHILNKDYFPELDIEHIYCDLSDPKWFEMLKDSYIEYDMQLYIEILLKDSSKESVTNALIALAPRADIDIISVFHTSYNLTDISNALKHIAGWSTFDKNYGSTFYDYNCDGQLELLDVVCMFKVVAGWSVKEIANTYVNGLDSYT